MPSHTPPEAFETSLNEHQYRTFVNNMPLGVFRSTPDPGGKLIAVNPALARIGGYDSPDEIIGLPAAHFYSNPADRAAFSHLILAEGNVSGIELQLKKKDGTPLWVSLSAHVTRAPDGSIQYFDGTIEDITERKRTEEALRDSEGKLHAMLQSIPEHMSMMDEDLNIIWANDTAKRLFGNDIVSRKCYEAYHRRDEPCEPAPCLTLKAFRDGKPHEHETQVISKDGTLVYFYCTANVALRNKEGKPTAVLEVSRNITERKHAEEQRLKLEAQLQQAQKLESLGMLAGGIAHDFNNLLAGIIGNADLALADLAPGAPAREPIEEAKKAGLRASELTRQLLAYTGKGPLVRHPVNLNELIEEMGHLLKVSISKKVTLAFNLADEPLAVMGDASQLQQVIMNLITNASEAIGDEVGVITLRTGVADPDETPRIETTEASDLPTRKYVSLEVADTGAGMDEETRAKIFDPFFTKKFTGRGLGLAAVQGIVRAHGGTIEVTSTLGEGTTFRVLLPRAVQPAEAPTTKATPQFEAWHGTGTILVVDDEEFVRDVMEKILTHAGFTVLIAGTGREGVEVFSRHADETTAVLLDMTMPEMSGEEVFREIRRIKPNVPIILTSGYSEADATHSFAGDDLAGFIQKPFELDTFIAKVRHALET